MYQKFSFVRLSHFWQKFRENNVFKHEYLRSRAYKCLSLSSSAASLQGVLEIYRDTRAYILDLASKNFTKEVNKELISRKKFRREIISCFSTLCWMRRVMLVDEWKFRVNAYHQTFLLNGFTENLQFCFVTFTQHVRRIKRIRYIYHWLINQVVIVMLNFAHVHILPRQFEFDYSRPKFIPSNFMFILLRLGDLLDGINLFNFTYESCFGGSFSVALITCSRLCLTISCHDSSNDLWSDLLPRLLMMICKRRKYVAKAIPEILLIWNLRKIVCHFHFYE